MGYQTRKIWKSRNNYLLLNTFKQKDLVCPFYCFDHRNNIHHKEDVSVPAMYQSRHLKIKGPRLFSRDPKGFYTVPLKSGDTTAGSSGTSCFFTWQTRSSRSAP